MPLVPAQRPVEPGEPVFTDLRYVDAQLDVPRSSQRRSYRASRAWMWFRSETPRAGVLFCRHTDKIDARQARKWVGLRHAYQSAPKNPAMSAANSSGASAAAKWPPRGMGVQRWMS